MLVRRRLVIGTIGSDCHMIGSWVLKKFLEEAGFDVTYLGAIVSQEEFVKAAVETKADAILVSSMYGMGIIDCEGLSSKCEEAGIGHVLLYAGGIVSAAVELERNWPEIQRRFKDMGFRRVYKNTVTPEEVIAALRSDLRVNDW